MAAAGGIPIKEMANTAMKPCIRFMSGCQPAPLDKNRTVLYTSNENRTVLYDIEKKEECMDETINAQRLHGKNVVVIGGSKGVGRAIVGATHAQGAQVLAVARKAEPLNKLAAAFPGVSVLALDGSSERAPATVFATLSPDILIVCAGAIPHAAPLVEQTFEQFSRNWNSDVKMSLLFSQAALTTPLPSGATIILISSGAAIGGSPLSGGYSGSKRTQMFIAHYAQQEAERLHLDVRFLALVPGGLMPETDLGKAAVDAYASSVGLSATDFIKRRGSSQTPEDVANAVVEFASHPRSREGNVFLISRKGIEALP
jgi:NAD(P)-dependent dehydrogenase (short-subunit alcohol dehydrogenase family)